MNGTMMYARVTFVRGSAGAHNHKAVRCTYSPLGHMYLRVGPLAISRHR
jgi:hypothetical protein